VKPVTAVPNAARPTGANTSVTRAGKPLVAREMRRLQLALPTALVTPVQ